MLEAANTNAAIFDARLFAIPAAEHLMTETAAAQYLGCSPRTLQRGRTTGEGPRYRRIGKRRVAYLRADLVEFVSGRGHASTSAEGYSRRRAT